MGPARRQANPCSCMRERERERERERGCKLRVGELRRLTVHVDVHVFAVRAVG